MGFGSDAVARLLRDLGLPFVALVPGSSYRGLHDSLVNYLGNSDPQMLGCLHEEHAVAIAHGYAKVTGRPMAAALHANVGLMHAAMAVYNAWCDRTPVVILGATGPVDAALRRPWIDWIHTACDQAALVRGYVKWDEQPASVPAALEAILRAHRIAIRAPPGPVYMCLDVTTQESPLTDAVRIPDPARYCPDPEPVPPPEALAKALRLLRGAKRPVLLAGRVSRDEGHWRERVQLAESLNASVVTDLKVAAAFPTDHRLHADAVSYDHQALPVVDVALPCPPDRVLAPMLEGLATREARARSSSSPRLPGADAGSKDHEVTLRILARALGETIGDRPASYLRLPLGWPAGLTPFRAPLDYLGYDGGAGVGSGPGMVTGMALALVDSGRLPVAILGDGDFLMGATALWTAAHYRIPLLLVVANNRSYFNDEVHQEKVASVRGRPTENRWIGQRLDDPAVDIPALARSLGIRALGSVTESGPLGAALTEAITVVEGGEPCLVDVRIRPGYEGPVVASAAGNRK